VAEGRTGGPGDARLVLASGVAHLDPERAVFDGMLRGWAAQQQSRLLNATTIEGRLWLVRRFAGLTNEYPWRWRPEDVEDFTTALRSGSAALAHSTIRGYQKILGLFRTSCAMAATDGRGSASGGSGGRRRRSATSGTRPCMSSSSRAGRAGAR
jgi:hypothetical protein